MDSPVTTIGWTSLTKVAKALKVQPAAVSHAARSGRLSKACVRRDPETGRVVAIHLETALKEWIENGDYTDSPQREPQAPVAVVAPAPVTDEWWADERERPVAAAPPGEETTVASAAARDKHWAAELKKLKYEQEAGELVSAKEVEAKLANVFEECKTKLLGIPTTMRQQDPTLTDEQLTAIEALIRESLFALAGAKDD